MIITFFENQETNEYYFSTSCSQKTESPSWVGCSITVPLNAEPRECIPNGVIRNKDDIRNVFLKDGIEVPNPDPKFQA